MTNKKQKFIIFDWAGNELTDHYGEFDSFEAAWDAVYDAFGHLDGEEFDEEIGEFHVEAK